MKKLYQAVTFIFFLGFAQNGFSQILFTASLNGSNEVPSVSTTGTATAWALLNPDMTSLTYRITYAQLSSAFTASHFHKAPIDSSGGVVQGITFNGNTASGTWSNISAENLAALLKGNIYINIHSADHPGGEIRGQLTAVRGIGFTANLDGTGENPDVATNGTGTAWAVLRDEGTEIEYALTFAGLTSNAVAAHFHNAPADSNGGVVQPITLTDSTVNESWTGFSDDMITQLLRSRLYVNVHTVNNPGGEIRGQLIHRGEIMYSVNMEGNHEIPEVDTEAKGTGWAVVAPDLSSLFYNFTYARLSSPFAAAHFHNAPSDSSGGVVKAITFNGNNATGTWTNITDFNLQQLIKERLYANVHSTNNPGGEIRGQLELVDGIGFTASLDAAQEGSSVVSNAKGTGWFNYTPNNLDYQITFAGLSGNFAASHFHNAALGLPGGVVQPITFTDSTTNASWADLTDQLLTELALGNLYVNIHSSAYPGGEIRGQVYLSNFVSGNVPVELTSFTANVNDNKVELRWSTATETNNAGFEIQKSVSGRNSDWQKIAFVEGKGSTTSPSLYMYSDEYTSTAGKVYYRLKQIDLNGTFEYSNVIEVSSKLPTKFVLNQNYPNPFNPVTTFSFSIPEKADVSLKVFNVLGKEVAIILNEVKEPGNFNVSFDASGLASGVYYYRLTVNDFSSTKKMILLK